MASTLHDPEAPTPPPAAPPRSLFTRRLPALGAHQMAFLGVFLLAMTLIPIVVTATRPERVTSEVVIEPVAGSKVSEGATAAYARRVLHLTLVQHTIAATRSRYWTLLGLGHVDVDVEAVGRGGQAAKLSVAGRTRAEAEKLANAAAVAVTARSRGALARRARARAKLRRLARALRDPDLSPERRSQLIGTRRFIGFDARLDAGAVALRVARPATRPAGDRIDRVVSKVARDGAPRPSPLWAGFAGLLLGLSLCALWLAVPTDRRPGPAPPGE
jgi:hypothetical protein